MKFTKKCLLLFLFIFGSTPATEAFSFKKTMSQIGAKIKKFPKLICGLTLATIAITAVALSRVEASPPSDSSQNPPSTPTPVQAQKPITPKKSIGSQQENKSFCAKYWKHMLAAGTLAFVCINQKTGMVEGMTKEFKLEDIPQIKSWLDSIPGTSWIATLGQSLTEGARPQNLIPGYLDRLKSFTASGSNILGTCGAVFFLDKISGKLIPKIMEYIRKDETEPMDPVSQACIPLALSIIGIQAGNKVSSLLNIPVNEPLMNQRLKFNMFTNRFLKPIKNAGIRFYKSKTFANGLRLAAIPIFYVVFDHYLAPAASSGISSAINYCLVNPLTTTIPDALNTNLDYWVAFVPRGASILTGKLAGLAGGVLSFASIMAIPMIGNGLAEAAISKLDKKPEPLRLAD